MFKLKPAPAVRGLSPADGSINRDADRTPPDRHVPAETLRRVASAYRGRTRSRSFPKALAVAGALDPHGVAAFTELLGGCPGAERELIATHLHRHYLWSPGRLAAWVRTAGHSYFYARARVANTGIGKARARPGRIPGARKADRDSAGFNVRQEARDAVSIINGIIQSPWSEHAGLGGQRSIISLAASLARLLIAEGDNHGLAGSYREYTDLYDARYSIVEPGTGLIDLVLKHPDLTGLLCEYIESGKYDNEASLRTAVFRSSQFLRLQQPRRR